MSKCGILLSSFLLSAAVALPATITGGTTSVALNSTFVSTVVGAGITPSAITPATLTGTTATFPITGGDTTTGIIDHSGGLSFTEGANSASIEDFVINLNTLVLTGNVIADNGTPTDGVALFNIGSGDTLTINSALASDLTAVFGVPNLTGALVGVATVSPVTSTATPEPGAMGLQLLGGVMLVTLWLRFRHSRKSRA